MIYRRLGKSGLQISALSLGSWITFGNQIHDATAEELMAYAYDQGVNFFDNAEVYGHGRSEIVMGNILKKMQWDRSSYLVSSKVFFGRGDRRPNMTGLSRKHIYEACHEALRRLQVDYLDLFFAHRPDKNTPMEETVFAFNHLIQQGKVLYWGTSEWSAQEIMEAHLVAKSCHMIGPTMEQPEYNMFRREKMEAEYLQLFKTVGLGTTIWSPLASGILTGKYNIEQSQSDARLCREELKWLRDKNLTPSHLEKTLNLRAISQKLSMSLAQLAIAWCLANENVSSAILGATSFTQLQENLASLDHIEKLTPEVLSEIDGILGNKPKLPSY